MRINGKEKQTEEDNFIHPLQKQLKIAFAKTKENSDAFFINIFNWLLFIFIFLLFFYQFHCCYQCCYCCYQLQTKYGINFNKETFKKQNYRQRLALACPTIFRSEGNSSSRLFLFYYNISFKCSTSSFCCSFR